MFYSDGIKNIFVWFKSKNVFREEQLLNASFKKMECKFNIV